MPETHAPEVPQTLEGWFILHDAYALDWPRWRAMDADEQASIAAASSQWLAAAAGCEQGDSAAYSLLGQKGDLMFVHYRESPEELNRAELSLRHTRLFGFLRPTFSYLSVIELGMYELTAVARKRLVEQGLAPGSPDFQNAFEEEMVRQKQRVQSRLFRKIPESRYICFYPMNKRRGEQVNWYTLSIEERRDLMRGHGRIGHKYHDKVTQIIGGSIGLDDWEWGVSLHADDALVFKSLVHEMRFDPASALYAEFGPFCIGVRRSPAQWSDFLAGRLS